MARVQRDKEVPASRGTDLYINQALETFPQGTEFPLAKGNSQGELSCESPAGSIPVSWGESNLAWSRAEGSVPGASASLTHLLLGS